MDDNWLHKDIPTLEIPENRLALYEKLDYIMNLFDSGDINYTAMVDLIHKQIQKYKNERKT